MLTFPVKLVAVFPRASRAATWTGGVITSPTGVLLGCTINASAAAAPGVTLNGVQAASVSPVAVAVSV